MTCDEAREAFSDLYDDTLSGAPLAAVTRREGQLGEDRLGLMPVRTVACVS